MPVYFINVDASIARRAFMERQFEALGILAERIAAVTPSELTPDDIHRSYSRSRRQRLRHGDLCCVLSHVKALRAFIEGGASHAAIFEDDAVLSSRLPAFLSAFAECPLDADIIHMETWNIPIRLPVRPFGSMAGVDLMRPYGSMIGAAGYIIARQAAECVLRDRQTLKVPIDWALFTPTRRFRVLQAFPALCIQEERYHPSDALYPSELRGLPDPLQPENAGWWVRAASFVKRDIIAAPSIQIRRRLAGAALRDVPFLP